MKLWHKLSLVCGAVLAAVILLCTAVQLRLTSENLLRLTTERAAEKQRVLADSFREMVNYYGGAADSPLVRRSLMSYCFNRFAAGGAVLVLDGEILQTQTEVVPTDYLPLEYRDTQAQYSGTIDGRRYFIAGSSVDLHFYGSPLCLVYVVEDISDVYGQIRRMTLQFLCIGLAGVAAGFALALLLVRRFLSPLGSLQKTASAIAAGDYGRRADIASRDEIGELARSFNSMAQAVQAHVDKLTDTAERQRLFIGAVTHEFKTPLTGILLNADNLQNTYMTEDEQFAALSAVQAQGAWLERLVQKLLALITVKREIVPAVFPVSLLLERVRESAQGLIEQRGLSLDIYKTDFDISGDIDLLQSALLNLIDNAGKASAPGGRISVTAADNYIEVRDFGCGMAADTLAHITEPFYTADSSRSKKQGGLGLGLALVQEIAAAHGARLEIESEPGRGTSARLRFQS